MQRFLSVLPFLVLAAVAGIAIALLFPQSSPLGGLKLPLSPEEITQKSQRLVTLFDSNVSGMLSETALQSDPNLVRQLPAERGLREANNTFRAGVPGFFWKVTWRKPDALDAAMRRSSGDEEDSREVLDILKGELTVRIDPSGHLLGFVRRIPDTLALPSLGADSARGLAQYYLTKVLNDAPQKELDWANDLRSVSESSRDQSGHREFVYLWSGTSKLLGTRTEIELTIAGNVLQRLELRYVMSESEAGESMWDVRAMITVLLYVIVIVAMIISAIRIIRAYELGFRLAIGVGIVVALAVLYQIIPELREFGAPQIVSLLLGPLFVGGGVFLLWSVAESVTREAGREKFISLDLLTRGYVLHSYVGRSVVYGIALGLVGYALLLCGVSLLEMLTPLRFDLKAEQVAKAFPAQMPLLSLLTSRFVDAIFVFAIFILFGVSWLRAHLPIPIVAVVVSAVVLGFNNFEHLSPAWPAIGIQALSLGVVVWAFYRYDVLASALALLTYQLMSPVMGMVLSGTAFYATPSIFYLAGSAALLVGGAALQYRRKELTSFDDITPAFARNITERQRLQQELEIARRVQMSFLPKRNPSIEGLDIAAQCIPAQEVGGDYFDFISLGPGKLGIAIGDVSGKGTQAAFYMTLAKGFLKALSPHHDSPAAVLSDMNRLFYENVDRGAFISMVYAILDVQGRTIQIARAGHNPVIMRKSEAIDIEVLQPTGLGLGLEAGETFSKTIEEVGVSFKAGDVFVFYTDGFSEAMNKEKQEFGEQQLYGVVNSVSGGSAQHILNEVFASVKKFVGREKQHDDMTLVVLKIT
jgi:phosphoserine phosphatase RsbU/P